MKYLKYIIILSVTVWVSSCGEPELPFDRFEDVNYGAYARRLSLDGEFNYFDPANSMYTLSVEFYDEDKGQNITSYDWTVQHINNAGGDDSEVVAFKSISAPFTMNEDGLPSATMTFGFQEALDALNLTIADVNGGDNIEFQATINKADGTSFTVTNTGTNIISSASFAAMFTLNAPIICPSSLEGTFDVVSTNFIVAGSYTCADGGGPAVDPWTGTVTWENQGGGNYTTTDLSFGQFPNCWADAPANSDDARVVDACGILSTSGADQYGDTYAYTWVSQTGPELVLDWVNTYGDAGTATLTRQDGNDWPPLTTN